MRILCVISLGIPGKSPGGDYKDIAKEIDEKVSRKFPGRFLETISREFLD